MYQVSEYLFYVGVVLIGLGLAFLLFAAIKRQSKRAMTGFVLIGVGGAVILGPAIYSRTVLAVDLGPREAVVDGETHISLNGWKGDSYSFLQTKNETVLLQMGNEDVTDETLRFLERMTILRELDLNDTQVTDAGLRTLGKLKTLEVVRLRGTKITDQGFRQHLWKMPLLNRLDLRDTDISDELIEEWKAGGESRRAFK